MQTAQCTGTLHTHASVARVKRIWCIEQFPFFSSLLDFFFLRLTTNRNERLNNKDLRSVFVRLLWHEFAWRFLYFLQISFSYSANIASSLHTVELWLFNCEISANLFFKFIVHFVVVVRNYYLNANWLCIAAAVRCELLLLLALLRPKPSIICIFSQVFTFTWPPFATIIRNTQFNQIVFDGFSRKKYFLTHQSGASAPTHLEFETDLEMGLSATRRHSLQIPK